MDAEEAPSVVRRWRHHWWWLVAVLGLSGIGLVVVVVLLDSDRDPVQASVAIDRDPGAAPAPSATTTTGEAGAPDTPDVLPVAAAPGSTSTTAGESPTTQDTRHLISSPPSSGGSSSSTSSTTSSSTTTSSTTTSSTTTTTVPLTHPAGVLVLDLTNTFDEGSRTPKIPVARGAKVIAELPNADAGYLWLIGEQNPVQVRDLTCPPSWPAPPAGKTWFCFEIPTTAPTGESRLSIDQYDENFDLHPNFLPPDNAIWTVVIS